jgi:hypothetical protein
MVPVVRRGRLLLGNRRRSHIFLFIGGVSWLTFPLGSIFQVFRGWSLTSAWSGGEDWVKLVKGCDEDSQNRCLTLRGVVVIFHGEGRDERVKLKDFPFGRCEGDWEVPRVWVCYCCIHGFAGRAMTKQGRGQIREGARRPRTSMRCQSCQVIVIASE